MLIYQHLNTQIENTTANSLWRTGHGFKMQTHLHYPSYSSHDVHFQKPVRTHRLDVHHSDPFPFLHLPLHFILLPPFDRANLLDFFLPLHLPPHHSLLFPVDHSSRSPHHHPHNPTQPSILKRIPMLTRTLFKHLPLYLTRTRRLKRHLGPRAMSAVLASQGIELFCLVVGAGVAVVVSER